MKQGPASARGPLIVTGGRFGAIAGVLAFASTLAANLAIILIPKPDLCRTGPIVLILLNVAAVAVFVLLAASAGLLGGRADGSVASAALAGVVVGAIGGCALVSLLLVMPALGHRLQELSARCPDTGAFGGGLSFSLGATPPPGVVQPSPPPGFAMPSSGKFTFASPSGVAGTILTAIGLLFTGFGMGLAVGAAALAGLVGVATRPREPAG